MWRSFHLRRVIAWFLLRTESGAGGFPATTRHLSSKIWLPHRVKHPDTSPDRIHTLPNGDDPSDKTPLLQVHALPDELMLHGQRPLVKESSFSEKHARQVRGCAFWRRNFCRNGIKRADAIEMRDMTGQKGKERLDLYLAEDHDDLYAWRIS